MDIQPSYSSIGCRVTMVGHTNSVRCVQMSHEKGKIIIWFEFMGIVHKRLRHFLSIFWHPLPTFRHYFTSIHRELLASFQPPSKVIYTKYSKHWPYTVAHTFECVCSKRLNNGLNHGFFLLLFKLISCPIHWILCVLAYLNIILEF